MSNLQEILSAANQLPIADRMALAQAIWDGMAPDQWPQPAEEWVAECQQRSQAIEAGQMTTSSWDEARARARRQAGLDA